MGDRPGPVKKTSQLADACSWAGLIITKLVTAGSKRIQSLKIQIASFVAVFCCLRARMNSAEDNICTIQSRPGVTSRAMDKYDSLVFSPDQPQHVMSVCLCTVQATDHLKKDISYKF